MYHLQRNTVSQFIVISLVDYCTNSKLLADLVLVEFLLVKMLCIPSLEPGLYFSDELVDIWGAEILLMLQI